MAGPTQGGQHYGVQGAAGAGSTQSGCHTMGINPIASLYYISSIGPVLLGGRHGAQNTMYPIHVPRMRRGVPYDWCACPPRVSWLCQDTLYALRGCERGSPGCGPQWSSRCALHQGSFLQSFGSKSTSAWSSITYASHLTGWRRYHGSRVLTNMAGRKGLRQLALCYSLTEGPGCSTIPGEASNAASKGCRAGRLTVVHPLAGFTAPAACTGHLLHPNAPHTCRSAAREKAQQFLPKYKGDAGKSRAASRTQRSRSTAGRPAPPAAHHCARQTAASTREPHLMTTTTCATQPLVPHVHAAGPRKATRAPRTIRIEPHTSVQTTHGCAATVCAEATACREEGWQAHAGSADTALSSCITSGSIHECCCFTSNVQSK